MSASQAVETMSDEDFLSHLRKLGNNWRYSDEFIGLIVRIRFPRDYSDLKARSEVESSSLD